MCDRSNKPHAERTAWCSARMPAGYCTGMSQPAKSTMRAPSRRCSALSGVRSKDGASLEGKDVAKDARQKDRNLGELLGEQQHPHANNQRPADSLNAQQMRAHAAHDAERAIHGQT